MKGFPEKDSVITTMKMLTIQVVLCCLHCRSVEYDTPLCAQGRGEAGVMVPLVLRRRSKGEREAVRNYEEDHHPCLTSPLCTGRGVIFNRPTWRETTNNYLYY